MAPSFEGLKEEDDGYDSAEDLDFSGTSKALFDEVRTLNGQI